MISRRYFIAGATGFLSILGLGRKPLCLPVKFTESYVAWRYPPLPGETIGLPRTDRVRPAFGLHWIKGPDGAWQTFHSVDDGPFVELKG